MITTLNVQNYQKPASVERLVTETKQSTGGPSKVLRDEMWGLVYESSLISITMMMHAPTL